MRGDVAKMLVHRRARGQGVGALLLRAAEKSAREQEGLDRMHLKIESSPGRLFVKTEMEKKWKAENERIMRDYPPTADQTALMAPVPQDDPVPHPHPS